MQVKWCSTNVIIDLTYLELTRKREAVSFYGGPRISKTNHQLEKPGGPLKLATVSNADLFNNHGHFLAFYALEGSLVKASLE